MLADVLSAVVQGGVQESTYMHVDITNNEGKQHGFILK
jgi:hypothetical protein